MQYEIFINSIFRRPMKQALHMFEDYQKNVGLKILQNSNER